LIEEIVMAYTEKKHAKMLIKMLEKTKSNLIEATCPMNIYINTPDKDNICTICKSFVGLKCHDHNYYLCPCCELTCEEAVKRTWLALEENEYI